MNEVDYVRATVLLDELTDGHALSRAEERTLVALEVDILAYERDSPQFEAFNASFPTATPVQLLKDVMETLQLTGSDLPEIGDEAAVAEVLGGKRPISDHMAAALAARFHTKPSAFAQTGIC